MSLSEDTIVDQGTRTAARIIGDQAVVVVIDAQKLHTFNEVGTRVWELSTRTRIGDIADAIAEEYQVTREEALADVLIFASALVSKGMLEVVPET